MHELKSRRKAFPEPSTIFEPPGPGFNPFTLLNNELREFLAVPRTIPRPIREDIAAVIAYEIFSGKDYEIKDEKRFIERFGAFYPLFLSMRNFPFWAEFRKLANTNRMGGIILLKTLLQETFILLENYPEIEAESVKGLEKTLKKALNELKELIEETLTAWGSTGTKNKSGWPAGDHISVESKSEWLEDERAGRESKSEWLEDERAGRESKSEWLEDERAGGKSKSEGPAGKRKTSEDRTPAEMKSHGEEALFQNSGKLYSLTDSFLSDENTGQAIDSVIEKRIAPKLETLTAKLEEHLEVLDILSLLFPARGWDHSMQALHRDYFEDLERYAAFYRQSSDLKAILEQVGRIELEYGSKKLGLNPHSKSEVHAVTFSHDLQTMLPVEAVKLIHPILKYKFYADMLEGKLLTYHLKGKDSSTDSEGRRRKGPVVALVDTSASMRGPPELLAKAVMLAVTKRMLKEGRAVKVILFSSKWQTVEIELTDKKRMGREFLDFLRHTFGGGTDFNTALRAGLKTLKEDDAFRGADLLFLTDGASEFSEIPLIREWNEIKKERKARIHSLILGNDSAGGLDQISDHTFIIRHAEAWHVRESPARFVSLLGGGVHR